MIKVLKNDPSGVNLLIATVMTQAFAAIGIQGSSIQKDLYL
tara:strand:+ start:186 stop:308 length:123 start_codon:yes stop_codon:yes gene_type:complete